MTQCIKCPIRQKTLFKNVVTERLGIIQSYRKEQVTVPARAEIFPEGEVHDYIYTLFSGWGVIYKTANNQGKRQILRFVLPGDLLGYQVNESGVTSHAAASITKVICCVFSRENLKNMLCEDPMLAVRLLEMESRDMSLCQNHLIAAGRKTARESIASLLMELYYRVRQQDPGRYFATSHSINFPLTQQNIGDAVGLTKIHVNRVMKELIKDGLISFQKKQLTILDERLLCEIAEFTPDLITSHSLA